MSIATGTNKSRRLRLGGKQHPAGCDSVDRLLGRYGCDIQSNPGRYGHPFSRPLIALKQFHVCFVDQDGGTLLHEVDDDGQAVLGVDFGDGAT